MICYYYFIVSEHDRAEIIYYVSRNTHTHTKQTNRKTLFVKFWQNIVIILKYVSFKLIQNPNQIFKLRKKHKQTRHITETDRHEQNEAMQKYAVFIKSKPYITKSEEKQRHKQANTYVGTI